MVLYFSSAGYALKTIYEKIKTFLGPWNPRGLRLAWSGFIAFLITWYCIISWMFLDDGGGRATEDQNVLVLAYWEVVHNPFGWFWSQMLLSWAVTAACIAPTCKGSKLLTPSLLLAFLVFGELVAISGTFPLMFVFFRGCIQSDPVLNKDHPNNTDSRANNKTCRAKDRNWVLVVIALVGQILVFLNRYTYDRAFDGSNVFEISLLLLHGIILVPVAMAGRGLESKSCLKGRQTALRLLAALAAVQHLIALTGAFLAADSWRTFPKQLMLGLVINRCQFSIGCDGIFAHFQSHVFHGIDNFHDSFVDTCYAMLFSPAAMYAIRSIPIIPKGAKNVGR